MKTLLQIFDLVLEHKLWPNKKPSEVLMTLMFLNGKGWLYTVSDNGKLTAALCGYRIKEVTKDRLKKLPLQEEGTILYVPFSVSLTDENIFKVIRKAFHIYIKENPDITELVLEDKNNKIKRYNLKGADNGKERRSGTTSHANVPN